jgi:single-stranded DNA-specific DHH superfamily exonuclease
MLEIVENIIKEKNLLDNKLLVIKLEDVNIDRNLTGLIANQLMAKYQRPVLLLNKVITKKIYMDENYKVLSLDEISWEGSGRGYDKSKFDNLREFLNDSGLVMYAEG